MSQEKNEVLSSVILMERIIPRLRANSRETIKRTTLVGISQQLGMVLKSLIDECQDPLVLTPIMEVVNLIETITSEGTFVETDDETKSLIVVRLKDAQHNLYMFAGRYYSTNNFTYTITKTDVLRHIVDECIDFGYYFGYDTTLKAEGTI